VHNAVRASAYIYEWANLDGHASPRYAN
jgi:hypothetical protein